MPRKWAKYPVASPETKQAVEDWLAQESEQEHIEYLRAELGKCWRERLELRVKCDKLGEDLVALTQKLRKEAS